MTTEHAPPSPRPTPAERLAIALGTSQTVPVEPSETGAVDDPLADPRPTD